MNDDIVTFDFENEYQEDIESMEKARAAVNTDNIQKSNHGGVPGTLPDSQKNVRLDKNDVGRMADGT